MTDEHDPTTRTARRRRLALLPMLAALALACDSTDPTSPASATDSEGPEATDDAALPEDGVALICSADVAQATVSCAPPPAPASPGNAVVIGGQDINVLLASSGTAYDSVDQIFGTTVTVQNLTRHPLGTPDGTTVEGIRIFFEDEPRVTAGSGTITIANADGTGLFTGSLQPFFHYGTLLQPLRTSDGKRWEFSVPNTVQSFEFFVFVSAPIVDEGAPLLGPVWTGVAGVSWSDPGNWASGEVPDSTASVSIPALALLEPGAAFPALTGDAEALHLRVGHESSLDLGGHRLRALGNVDADGAVSNGTMTLAGEESIAGGKLSAVEVTGGVTVLQPTTVAGSLTVSGSLVVGGSPLVIEVP